MNDTALDSPTLKVSAPQERSSERADQQPSKPADPVAAPEKAKEKSARPWTRRTLFALLPLALIGGGYWYVTGGRVMSTDDAYVEADKVGLSTDVSGIVKTIAVVENQKVDAGEVLFRLDDLPFQLTLRRAEAQVSRILLMVMLLDSCSRSWLAAYGFLLLCGYLFKTTADDANEEKR